jgi:hypothetical protein
MRKGSRSQWARGEEGENMEEELKLLGEEEGDGEGEREGKAWEVSLMWEKCSSSAASVESERKREGYMLAMMSMYATQTPTQVQKIPRLIKKERG